jgi:curved DNA-binding protein CbpA
MTGWNPWAVLGVAEDASYDEIQRAYREKVKQTHPDRGGAAGDFRRVASAVEDLRRLRGRGPDATILSQYDRWLRPHHPKGLHADYGRPSHRATCGRSVARNTSAAPSAGSDFGALLRREMTHMTQGMSDPAVGVFQ